MTVCSVEGCTRRHSAKGWCAMHYNRAQRHGDPLVTHQRITRHEPLAQRLERQTDRSPHPTGCWTWVGAVHANGYGVILANGRQVGAHRAAYELAKGSVPPGLMVLHSCDNPVCVNPDHLRAGTHDDNMRDKVERGRQARLSGESAPNARLTQADVDEIRAAAHSGARHRVIAQRYGVSRSNVGMIVQHKRWAVAVDA